MPVAHRGIKPVGSPRGEASEHDFVSASVILETRERLKSQPVAQGRRRGARADPACYDARGPSPPRTHAASRRELDGVHAHKAPAGALELGALGDVARLKGGAAWRWAHGGLAISIERNGGTHAQYRQGRAQLAFGENSEGRIVHVSAVPDGQACGCICPACSAPLIAREGSRARHFAHKVDTACVAARETLLHRLAKQILQDAGWLHLPAAAAEAEGVRRQVRPARDFTFDRVESEVRAGDVIPDILIWKGSRQLFVEIWVSHACGPEKIAKLRVAGVSTLEIDVRKVPRFASLAEVEDAVLRTAPRTWLFNPYVEDAMAQVQEVLAAREAARNEAFDRAAAQAAADWDRAGNASPADGAHADLSNIAAGIDALGYGAFLGLRHKADRGLAVAPRIWQAQVFQATVLARASQGRTWAVSVAGLLASLRRDGLVAPLFAKDIEPRVLSRLRQLRPQLRTPSELLRGYLRHLTKAGLLEERDQWWRPPEALCRAIEEKRREVRAAADRRWRLSDRVESLLRRCGIPAETFDASAWLQRPLRSGRTPKDVAQDGGPLWEALEAALSVLEAALRKDVETPDCLGLPLEAAIANAAAKRQADALKAQEEAEARALAAAEMRGAQLAEQAWRRLGPEAEAWLSTQRKSDGATRLDAARASDAEADRLYIALERAGAARAERLEREERARAALADLKRQAVARLGEERAALFLTVTDPVLGASPTDYCTDARALAECLRRLPAKPRRRAT